MNFEEQQQQISDLNKELQTDLDFGGDIKLEEFQRPTFGGTQPPVETDSGGQYNRAPTQPDSPKPAVSTITEISPAAEPVVDKPIEAPVEVETVSTEDSATDTPSSETKKS